MAHEQQGTQRIQTADLGDGILLARFVGNELGLFGRDDASELFDLVERADRDPTIRAVVFTGSHPGRFISHADLQWLQEDGSVIPPVGRRVTGAVARSPDAIASIKRAVNVGGSLPLERGLHVERAEFLASLTQRRPQRTMLSYLSETAHRGELPLYRPGGYAAALSQGSVGDSAHV